MEEDGSAGRVLLVRCGTRRTVSAIAQYTLGLAFATHSIASSHSCASFHRCSGSHLRIEVVESSGTCSSLTRSSVKVSGSGEGISESAVRAIVCVGRPWR